MYNHPTSLRQDQSVAVATTNFALTNERRTRNVTKQKLYAYIWDPLRLVKVGYDYRLYYTYFISLFKIGSS